MKKLYVGFNIIEYYVYANNEREAKELSKNNWNAIKNKIGDFEESFDEILEVKPEYMFPPEFHIIPLGEESKTIGEILQEGEQIKEQKRNECTYGKPCRFVTRKVNDAFCPNHKSLMDNQQ